MDLRHWRIHIMHFTLEVEVEKSRRLHSWVSIAMNSDRRTREKLKDKWSNYSKRTRHPVRESLLLLFGVNADCMRDIRRDTHQNRKCDCMKTSRRTSWWIYARCECIFHDNRAGPLHRATYGTRRRRRRVKVAMIKRRSDDMTGRQLNVWDVFFSHYKRGAEENCIDSSFRWNSSLRSGANLFERWCTTDQDVMRIQCVLTVRCRTQKSVQMETDGMEA